MPKKKLSIKYPRKKRRNKTKKKRQTTTIYSPIYGRYDRDLILKDEFHPLLKNYKGMGFYIHRPDEIPSVYGKQWSLKYHKIYSPISGIIRSVRTIQYDYPIKRKEHVTINNQEKTFIANKMGRVEWKFETKYGNIYVYIEVGYPKFIVDSVKIYKKQGNKVYHGEIIGEINVPHHPNNSNAGLIIPKNVAVKIKKDHLVTKNSIIGKL